MGNQVTKSGSSLSIHQKNDSKSINNSNSNSNSNDNHKNTLNADALYPQLLVYKGIIISYSIINIIIMIIRCCMSNRF